MLKLDKLFFSYKKGLSVLEDLSFTVPEGSITAILGPNGAGKTTLIQCLLGILKPDSGSIKVAGKDISGLSNRERARLMAYVPQFSGLSFSHTAYDVVMMGRLSHQAFGAAPGRNDDIAVREALHLLGISAMAEKKYQRLSGGEKQLVIMARTLAQQAKLLIMDEPTASLDFYNQAQSLQMISDLSKQNLSILMSTHSPDHALLVADQVIMLKNKKIMAAGPPDELITEESLSHLYGIKAQMTTTSLKKSGREVKICVPIIDI